MNIEIKNMDCLDGLQDIADNSIDVLITDPPYSTPVITSFGRKRFKNLADLSIQEGYFRMVKKELERVLKPNGRCFFFCDDKFYPILFSVFYEWQNLQLLIWDKGRIGMGKPIRKQHELIAKEYLRSAEYLLIQPFTLPPHLQAILDLPDFMDAEATEILTS